MNTHKKILS